MNRSLFITAYFILTIGMAQAIDCYKFTIDTPEKEQLSHTQSKILGCYKKLNQNERFVFVLEENVIKHETAALITSTGKNSSLKHFSASAGKMVLVEKEGLEINPLPIPLEIDPTKHEKTDISDLPLIESSLNSSLNAFRAEPNIKVATKDFSLNYIGAKSVEQSYLPEDKIPSDGYWWPQKGAPLANGVNSPLAKYDAYVKSVTGNSPNSVAWEMRRHAGNLDWTGHCNGWVSATILYGYDDFDLKDENNNTVITSSDIQGLRSAISYCTRNAFYGKRNYGRPWNDKNDIYPHRFHRLLKYYIDKLKKPVSYDYDNTAVVDNHIISGYTFTYEETEQPYKYLVKAELLSHEYSDTFVHEKRIAPTSTRTYWYYLYTTPQGTPYKGEWINENDHPDFLWVPLREARCRGENPRLSTYWLNHMFRNLEKL